MNPPSSETALERQIATLKERTRKAETILKIRRQRRENRELTKQRKLETRRKILTGKAVLIAIEHNPQLKDWFYTQFPKHLTNDRDRKLFQELTFNDNAAQSPRPSRLSQLRQSLSRLSSLTRFLPRHRNPLS
ncbi:MAG: hypothetical protein OXB98_23230 [Bryobacterales bacterium]|nr:hypothetical protein [Bryobacterales bacterium]